MALFFFFMLTFSIGFIFGARMRSVSFDNQDWMLFKWCNGSLGYRPIQIGTLLYPNDKLVMGLHMDTGGFPPEGTKYEKDA